MTYADIMAKLKASRVKVEKLKVQLQETTAKITALIQEEEASQPQMIAELQTALAEELGQDVKIGKTATTPKQKKTPQTQRTLPLAGANLYNKKLVLDSIDALRTAGVTSWDEIADRLNSDGLKPKTAEKFTGPAVYQLHKSRPKSDGAVA